MLLRTIGLLSLAALASAEPLHVQQTGFKPSADGLPAGWRTWAARSEIAPRTFVDLVHYRHAPGSLAIAGNTNAAEYGGWEYAVPGVQPGKWYRFSAHYRAEGLQDERRQVVSRLDWAKADGTRAGQPDYVYAGERAGEWTRVSVDAPAPDAAASVRLQLYLQNAPYATIWWNDISLEEIAAPGARPVRVASINLRPRDTHSAEQSVSEFLDMVRKSVPSADVILLPEGITVVGTGKHYPDVAESIPGPTTERLVRSRVRNTRISWPAFMSATAPRSTTPPF